MRIRHRLAAMLTAVALLVGSQSNGTAAEYSFAPYGLGAAAFGAGVTPPPGTYNTAATAFYAADIAASIQFGGVRINAGAHFRRLRSGAKPHLCPGKKTLGRKPRIVSHSARGAHSVLQRPTASRD